MAGQHVDVLSVHDCFYVRPEWVRRTKLKYADVLRELLVEVTPAQFNDLFIGLNPTVKADVRAELEGCGRRGRCPRWTPTNVCQTCYTGH